MEAEQRAHRDTKERYAALEELLINTKCAWADSEHKREKQRFKLQRKRKQIAEYGERMAGLEVEVVRCKQDMVDMMNSMYEMEKHGKSGSGSSEGLFVSPICASKQGGAELLLPETFGDSELKNFRCSETKKTDKENEGETVVPLSLEQQDEQVLTKQLLL